MNKLEEDLLRRLGDQFTVDIVMEILRNHVCTITCESEVPELDHKYGSRFDRQQLDSVIHSQMLQCLADEMIKEELVEFGEEYSSVYQTYIKSASIKLFKADNLPKHKLIRY